MPDSVDFAPDLYHGTAQDYERFRAPYPPALVDHLLGLVEPRGDGWLLDLACGTGQIAFAVRARFGSVWAVDQEPDMIALVRAKAARAGVEAMRTVVSSAEELSAPPARFELVTIGNAFHRLKRDVVAANVARWLEPGGHLALVWGNGPWTGEHAWQSAFRELVARWKVKLDATVRVPSGWERSRRERPDRTVLKQAGLHVAGRYEFPTAHEWTIEALAGFVYSTSVLPRAVLGDQLPAFEDDLRRVLEPFGSALRQTIDFAYELARRGGEEGSTHA